MNGKHTSFMQVNPTKSDSHYRNSIQILLIKILVNIIQLDRVDVCRLVLKILVAWLARAEFFFSC